MTDKQAHNELQRRIDVYGLHFGITRMQGYSNVADGWWVRLGWKEKRPAFQQMVYDHDHDSSSLSEKAALRLRDRMFVRLWQEGLISPAAPRPMLTRRNKTGIAGMTRQKTASKSGAGYFWSWKVNWREGGKAKGRTFADSTYGGAKESYRAAALWRMEIEFRVFGDSLIDPEQIDALYEAHFGISATKPCAENRKGQGEAVDMTHMTLLDTDGFRGVRVAFACAGFCPDRRANDSLFQPRQARRRLAKNPRRSETVARQAGPQTSRRGLAGRFQPV